MMLADLLSQMAKMADGVAFGRTALGLLVNFTELSKWRIATCSNGGAMRRIEPEMGSRRRGKGRRKVGRKKRRMRSKIRHRKK